MNDLNLFIATQIEPKPDSCVRVFGLSPLPDLSPLKCWRWLPNYSLVGSTGNPFLEDRGDWITVDFRTDPAAILMLMERMKKDGMSFHIESEPDFKNADDIKAHGDAIREYRDYGIALTWGDSNCSHSKPYDPVDGHGYTDLYIIADSFGEGIALAFARAHGYKPSEEQ